jgi:hypothetical protein
MWAFFAALLPGEFPHTVELAAQLARISTDDQFQFGIRTFLAGLNSGESLTASLTQSKRNKQPRPSDLGLWCAPRGIRTPNRQIRSLVLYPLS